MTRIIDCTLTPGTCVVHEPAIAVHSKAAFYDACRRLAELGHGDAALQAHDEHGKPTIRAASISAAAKWTVTEDRNNGPRMVRWMPFPDLRSRQGEGSEAPDDPECQKAPDHQNSAVSQYRESTPAT